MRLSLHLATIYFDESIREWGYAAEWVCRWMAVLLGEFIIGVGYYIPRRGYPWRGLSLNGSIAW